MNTNKCELFDGERNNGWGGGHLIISRKNLLEASLKSLLHTQKGEKRLIRCKLQLKYHNSSRFENRKNLKKRERLSNT